MRADPAPGEEEPRRQAPSSGDSHAVRPQTLHGDLTTVSQT